VLENCPVFALFEVWYGTPFTINFIWFYRDSKVYFDIMYSVSQLRKMALVGCAILALTLPRAAYAMGDSDSGSSGKSGSGQTEKTESSQSGGGEHGGADDGGRDNGGSTDGGSTNGGSDNDGGEDGGDDSGGNTSSGSGSQSSVQNSGNSGTSQSGKVASQDEVLTAVRAGKAVSLPLLLAFMANKFPGEIVDVKLKNKAGLYSYEVEYLANSSKLRVLKLDAKTLSKL
jgi:hypothetical protein